MRSVDGSGSLAAGYEAREKAEHNGSYWTLDQISAPGDQEWIVRRIHFIRDPPKVYDTKPQFSLSKQSRTLSHALFGSFQVETQHTECHQKDRPIPNATAA